MNILLILHVAITLIGSAAQTDWSGGGGIHGPVADWQNRFYTSAGVDYPANSLKLSRSILTSPYMHTVLFDHNPSITTASDLDGDGDLDILITLEDEISWLENSDTSPGVFYTSHTIDTNFDDYGIVAESADIDGDGDKDVIASYYYGGTYLYNNIDGSGLSWNKQLISTYDAEQVFPVDIDGDDDLDLIVNLNGIRLFENLDGSGGSWENHVINQTMSTAFISVEDIDNDGDFDIACTTTNLNYLVWLENYNGSGQTWVDHIVNGIFMGAHFIATADLDGDGDTDLISSQGGSNSIYWWENLEGPGDVWTMHQICDDLNYAKLFPIDVDNDGDIDIVASGSTNPGLRWFCNSDGSGLNWEEHVVSSGTSFRSSLASDIDNDGDMEILSNIWHQAAWWDLFEYESQGNLESSILEVNEIASWQQFNSNSQIPLEASVGFQFRSSSDASAMGNWSGTIYSPEISLAGVLEDSTKFVQYKVILETTNQLCSPILEDILLVFYQLGIEGENTHPPTVSVDRNPNDGNFSLEVYMPDLKYADLMLYDVSGRCIRDASSYFPEGNHSIDFYGLPNGVYCIYMNADNYITTSRIIVLN